MGKVIWCTVALVGLLVAWLMVRNDDDPLVVKTSTGLVKGKLSVIANQTCTLFFGIPYAQPPIGNLRFSRPQMVDSWTHTHKAYEYGPDCMPALILGPKHKESEDCLYLNVWVPKPSTRGPRPVIVYIHGGGFVAGSGRLFGDLFPVLSDTIVVSMNYRLNSFGFLNLYTKEASGNMGLFDQQLALTWVKTNIEAFGGDSNRITILGISAGAASVGYHLLSPGSQELFNRAIMHSGSPIDSWAFDNKDLATTNAMGLADLAQCNRPEYVSNPKDIVKCLQQVPAKELNELTNSTKLLRPMRFSFVPSIDGHFLSATPSELLSKGKFKKTQLIIGNTKNEGSNFLYLYFSNYFMKGLLSINQVAEITRMLYPKLSDAQIAAVHRHYFGISDSNNTLENTIKAADMLGDSSFLCSSNSFVETFANFGGKAYHYHFVHRKYDTWFGVMHGVDFYYAVGEVLKTEEFTEAEKNLSRRIITQWAAFAESGDPSTADYTWPVYNEQSRRYYKVDTNPPVTEDGPPRTRQCNFWKDIDDVNPVPSGK